MSAARHNKDLAAFSARLLNQGKPRKVVIIAVARKRLTILNAMIRTNTPWTSETA